MKTFLRICAFLSGVATIVAVIWLGYQTSINQSPKLVAVFGVASAIAAPLGFNLISYAFRSNDKEVIQRLAKVPEIERLIQEAKSQEEKIELLEQQKSQLADIVMFEARRQTLEARRKSLEEEGIRVLNELRAIEEELDSINAEVRVDDTLESELAQLRDRIEARQRGDIIFTIGEKSFFLDESLFSDPYTYKVLRLLSKRINRLLNQMMNQRNRNNKLE